MHRSRFGAVCLLLAASLMLPNCSDPAGSLEDAPEGHSELRDGVSHAPGANNPAENCSACHGAALQGGASGEPSCFQCHGRVW